MNARPLLELLAETFSSARLEVVLVGCAAAALEGAPVTTEDFDFMWRPTRTNHLKLRAVAESLGAALGQPKYPVSDFYRMDNPAEGLQVDLLAHADGVRSFESLRSRARRLSFRNGSILVASLEDVVKSKRAAGRSKDKAVLPVLEETLRAQERGRTVRKMRLSKKRMSAREASRREAALREREQILAKLRLPPEERTHFLRVRLPGGGSVL